MRFFFSLLVLLALTTAAGVRAQGLSQTIRGRILDRESQQPLVGAMVVVLSTSPPLTATTDVDGTFKIGQVPVGATRSRSAF